MAGVYYGEGDSPLSGIEPSLIKALSSTGMDPKDLAAILGALKSWQDLQAKSTSNTMDVDQAVLSGTYAPPPQQDYPAWQPTWVITPGFANQVITGTDGKPLAQNPLADAFKIVADLNAVPLDPTTFVAKVLANEEVVQFLRRANIAPEEMRNYLDTNYRQALNEREANINSHKKWELDKAAFDRQQVQNDPFLSRGLPSWQETYGLQADPSKGVQQLPLDPQAMAFFDQKGQEYAAKDAARPRQQTHANTSQGIADAFFGQGGQQQPSDLRSLGVVRDFYMNNQLAQAQAQGRTPLTDNLQARKSINNDAMSVLAALLGARQK